VENARVIVGDGTVLERGSVVVAGEWIVSVTDEEVEASEARRIDASGKAVLPGLIDAHAHVAEEPGTEAFGRQHLAFGTTSIRDVGGPLDSLLAWRERWSTGDRPGPRLFLAGHPLDGDPPDWPYPGIAWPVTRTEEAELAVGLQHRLGVDLIKLYSALEPQVLKAAIEAAHERELPVTADLWRYTGSFDSVFAWGLDSFEHGFALCCGERLPRPSWRSDRGVISELVDALLEHDVTLVSTAVILDRQIGGGFPPDAPTYRALPPELQEASRNMWEQSRGSEPWSEILADLEPGWPDEVCGPIRRFVDGGGQLALGTDSFLVVAYPGDVIAEAVFLAECGLEPATILAALTRNAAALLDRENELGTLEAGKLADLIVVDGNPLEDMSTLWNVEVVVKGGEVVVGESTTPTEAPAETAVRREEITFASGDLRLAGTLTLPAGPSPHPALVLVPGGGPRAYDRDSTRPGDFQPFRLLADHLAEQGVASLRYDERGVGSSE
jgi:imidazolonepropionase-like amidohydrolase